MTDIQYRDRFVEHLSLAYAAQHSVTRHIALMVMNLVTPKAGAKSELFFNKPASGLTVVLLKSDLDLQQTHFILFVCLFVEAREALDRGKGPFFEK
jgi:hypothetical protein